MATSEPTIHSRWLGSAMLQARREAGLTIGEAATRAGWQGSKISRIENGRVRVHWGDIQDLLDAYGVTDEVHRKTLISLAKSLRKRGWWHAYGAPLSHSYTDFLTLEGSARELRVYQPQIIPGLLQTRGYAMALVGSSHVRADAREVEPFVEVRQARQDILTRVPAVHLRAIVGEAALRQRLGGRDVMDEQLRHLLRMSELPSVTLQVFPFSAEAGTAIFGPFTILCFNGPEPEEIVFLENLMGGFYLEQQDEISHYQVACTHLCAAALPPAESAHLIQEVLKEMSAS